MPAQLACHFGISSADTRNCGRPWWELNEDKNTEVQNVKLFLWHHHHYFVPLSVWSTAARVLINFYLGSATLTSTTLKWAVLKLVGTGAVVTEQESINLKSVCRDRKRGRWTAREELPYFHSVLFWSNPGAFWNDTMGSEWVSSASGEKNIPRP